MRRSICGLSTLLLLTSLCVGCASSGPDEAALKTSLASRVDMAEPRVSPIPLKAMSNRQRALLGVEEGQPPPKRALSNLHATLANNPSLMEVYYPLGDRVFRAPEIPVEQRELIILRVAWLYQDKYEWAQHQKNALEAGWTREDLERIKIGASSGGWQHRDSVLLKATDQIVRNAYLDDEVWADLREFYSVSDVMVLVTLVTHFHWVATITRSFGVEPDAPLLYFD